MTGRRHFVDGSSGEEAAVDGEVEGISYLIE